jgi:hypothetical protein
VLVFLIVLLGSVTGAAVVMPHEDRTAVIVFAVVNAIFAALVSSALLAGISIYRDIKASRR